MYVRLIRRLKNNFTLVQDAMKRKVRCFTFKTLIAQPGYGQGFYEFKRITWKNKRANGVLV